MKLLVFTFVILLGVTTQVCNAVVCEEENIFGITKYKTCPGINDLSDAQFCCGSKEDRYCCSSPFGIDDEDIQEMAKNAVKIRLQRSPQVPTTEGSVSRKNVVTQEGFRDNVKKVKDKVKQKVNSTVSGAKDKVKQKIKDKAIEKVEKKLDPTGGHMKLPAILGTLFAVVIGLIVLCVVCCCCCPFCLLHKRRQRGTVHNPNPAAAQPMPVMTSPPTQPGYAPVQTTPYPPQQQPYQPQPYPPQGYPQQPPQGYMPHPGFQPQSNAPYPTIPQPTDVAPGENPPPYAEKQMAFNPNY